MKLRELFDDRGQALRRKALMLLAGLVVLNLAAWACAAYSFRAYPLLLGTATLAWTFGLRHALDADHIAAIDNVTRTLMQAGQRPVAVGFFFSLGHSSVVVLATVALAATASALHGRFAGLHAIGSLLGTVVSAGFLLLIALVNLMILRRTFRALRRHRAGQPLTEAELDAPLAGGGTLSALLRPAFRMVSRSWHMYPLGFLFGLGFDTATEVGLLGVSATQAAHGLNIWAILIFPLLFTAAMSLVDTIDSILMLGAYGWAYVQPLRKLYYNLAITGISVLVAVLVGAVELLGLFGAGDRAGPFWALIARLNDNLWNIGAAIVGLFLAAWLISAARARTRGARADYQAD